MLITENRFGPPSIKHLPTPMPSFTLDTTVPLLQSVTVSPHIVYKKLLDINPGKSPGPEGWPLIALSEAAEQICIPLSILFTQSLEIGLLPQDWKSVHAM